MALSEDTAALVAAQLVRAHVAIMPEEALNLDEAGSINHDRILKGVKRLFAHYLAHVQSGNFSHEGDPRD